MSRTLNYKNLDGLNTRKLDSLSVMGHQKDVKENAFSQVSANIKYKPEEAKSVPRSRPLPVKLEAER